MTFSLRATTPSDAPIIEQLLARSYPVLLKADYSAVLLARCLPLLCKAQPRLLASGTYYIAQERRTGKAVGVGGWSADATVAHRGHIRHVATDRQTLRRGIGRAIIEHAFETARAAGVREMMCHATRTAVPFYAALGFVSEGEVELPLSEDLTFPAVVMRHASRL